MIDALVIGLIFGFGLAFVIVVLLIIGTIKRSRK